MNKMIIAVFDTEDEAYEGLDAMKELDAKGDITLYATSVIVKDLMGSVEVKQAAEEGPVGTAVGMLTGAMVGLLAGPVGATAGASIGGLTGLAYDTGNAGVNLDFLDEVSEVLIPGTTALLAEVDEDWVSPIDTRIEQAGGIVFRRPRSEVIDDQLLRDSIAYNQEVKELQQELKDGSEKSKAAAKKRLKSVQTRLKETSAKAEAKLDQINKETQSKVKNLQNKIKKAGNGKKEKINNRIAELKADQKARSEKLQQANELARQALTV